MAGGACMGGETATAADGTHPTGMLSCLNRHSHKQNKIFLALTTNLSISLGNTSSRSFPLTINSPVPSPVTRTSATQSFLLPAIP